VAHHRCSSDVLPSAPPFTPPLPIPNTSSSLLFTSRRSSRCVGIVRLCQSNCGVFLTLCAGNSRSAGLPAFVMPAAVAARHGRIHWCEDGSYDGRLGRSGVWRPRASIRVFGRQRAVSLVGIHGRLCVRADGGPSAQGRMLFMCRFSSVAICGPDRRILSRDCVVVVDGCRRRTVLPSPRCRDGSCGSPSRCSSRTRSWACVCSTAP
jgi:hypothetical protein